LHEALGALGLDVLLDDRAERPGVKFKDADLLGLPIRITIGNRIQEGRVEIRDRKTGLSVDVPLEQVVGWCQAHLAIGK
jgi:prolyl-tRNA synthetase